MACDDYGDTPKTDDCATLTQHQSHNYYFIITAQRAGEYCIVNAPLDWMTYPTGTRTELFAMRGAWRQLLWFYYCTHDARCVPRDRTSDINFQTEISSPCTMYIENVWKKYRYRGFGKSNKILSRTYTKIVFFFLIRTGTWVYPYSHL